MTELLVYGYLLEVAFVCALGWVGYVVSRWLRNGSIWKPYEQGGGPLIGL